MNLSRVCLWIYLHPDLHYSHLFRSFPAHQNEAILASFVSTSTRTKQSLNRPRPCPMKQYTQQHKTFENFHTPSGKILFHSSNTPSIAFWRTYDLTLDKYSAAGIQPSNFGRQTCYASVSHAEKRQGCQSTNFGWEIFQVR